ncbi:hypothetical protein ScalyP_jg5283, partial [Parmales sp. scaly parma]
PNFAEGEGVTTSTITKGETTANSVVTTGSGSRPVAKEKVKAAPKGVPTLSRWTCNDDLTVSGFVSNSPNFTDGERITTSALSTKENQIKEGAVVVTGSGSKYYLS